MQVLAGDLCNFQMTVQADGGLGPDDTALQHIQARMHGLG